MIIEDLVRLGKPLLEGGMDARDILELISDVNDEKVKNFFRHVFVVELPPEGSAAMMLLLFYQCKSGDRKRQKLAKQKKLISNRM